MRSEISASRDLRRDLVAGDARAAPTRTPGAPCTSIAKSIPTAGSKQRLLDRRRAVDDGEHRRRDEVRMPGGAGGVEVEVQRVGLADGARVLADLLARRPRRCAARSVRPTALRSTAIGAARQAPTDQVSARCSSAASSSRPKLARARRAARRRARVNALSRATWRKIPIGVAPPSSVGEAAEREREARVLAVRVVAQQRVLADLGDRRRPRSSPSASRTMPRSSSAPKRIGWPCSSSIDVRRARLLVGQRVERAVVEHGAVLVDLDQRRARVRGGGAQHRRQVVLVGVERARDERRAGAERQRDRVERRVDRAERRRLGHLAELAGRRRLALREPVDAVVEEQDLDRHVAAQRVDQVVAADRERVAVARDDPHREIGARGGEPGRERRRAAVDAVHPVGVHVVGEAARAADPGDEHGPLRRDPELGQEPLHGGEDRVVAAARAPARLDVGDWKSALVSSRGAVLGQSVGAHSRSSSSPFDLGGQQRPALGDRVAVDVARELGAQHLHELAVVHLGDEHALEARRAPRRCSPAAG